MTKPTTTAYPVQVDAALRGKIKVDDHVDCLDVDASSNQVRADECLELSLSKALEHSDSLIASHIGMQALVLVLLFIEFSRQDLGSFVGPAEDDTLIDDKRAIKLEDGSHFLPLVDKHVVVSQADQHEFVH